MTINLNRLAHRDCLTAIATRQDFTNSTGSFHGEWSAFLSSGYAPPAVRVEIRSAQHPEGDEHHAHTVYVVYSYGTPIAYAEANGPLVVFPHKYSVTTSRHSSICRNA